MRRRPKERPEGDLDRKKKVRMKVGRIIIRLCLGNGNGNEWLVVGMLLSLGKAAKGCQLLESCCQALAGFWSQECCQGGLEIYPFRSSDSSLNAGRNAGRNHRDTK